MRNSRIARLAAITTVSISMLAMTGLSSPAQARTDERPAAPCAPSVSSARGGPERGADTRDVTASEQKAITAKAKELAKAQAAAGTTTSTSVPVYVHVMVAADRVTGDVTDSQITKQIAVLNNTFAGAENTTTASNTGFSFYLAKTDRYYNNSWHQDKQSSTYRSRTRLGGANALNIWLVDFSYLGIATFPWDYARSPGLDGIRVNFGSLPDGPIANYNFGETATHEAGHWFGLYHTFQGGCTTTNDEVSDTAAQSSSTSGCPIGRDSCTLPGLDPIHNYMDYSYDTCYDMFSAGQTARMGTMWSYRA